jgi:hypothetical protein
LEITGASGGALGSAPPIQLCRLNHTAPLLRILYTELNAENSPPSSVTEYLASWAWRHNYNHSQTQNSDNCVSKSIPIFNSGDQTTDGHHPDRWSCVLPKILGMLQRLSRDPTQHGSQAAYPTLTRTEQRGGGLPMSCCLPISEKFFSISFANAAGILHLLPVVDSFTARNRSSGP